jgi:hypothetical protein
MRYLQRNPRKSRFAQFNWRIVLFSLTSDVVKRVVQIVVVAFGLLAGSCAIPPADPNDAPVMERMERQPESSPTPPSNRPIERPLDPAGLPR